MRTLVWFRGKELRVADHAPLREAAAAGELLPLFVDLRRARERYLAAATRHLARRRRS